METFGQFYKRTISEKESFNSIDDFSDTIVEVVGSGKLGKNVKRYENCSNTNYIVEFNFGKFWNVVKNKSFAVISANKGDLSRKTNVLRNKMLREKLRRLGSSYGVKFGFYQLVGHATESPSDMTWDDAKERGMLIDSIERSYLIPRPEGLSMKQFEEAIIECLTVGIKRDIATPDEIKRGLVEISQDSALICDDVEVDPTIYIMNAKGEKEALGTKRRFLTPEDFAMFYSAALKKKNLPFVFEGWEYPSDNFGKLRIRKTTDMLF